MATKISRPLAPDVGHGVVPYSLATRRERSRELAQKRRTTYKTIMDDLTRVLPFPKDVVAQLDYNSKLRLALCFFRLKALIGSDPTTTDENGMGIEGCESGYGSTGMSLAVQERQIPSVFPHGMVQNLMTEVSSLLIHLLSLFVIGLPYLNPSTPPGPRRISAGVFSRRFNCLRVGEYSPPSWSVSGLFLLSVCVNT